MLLYRSIIKLCMSVFGAYYTLGLFFFFQAEDGIRDLVRSRGLEMCIRDRLHTALQKMQQDSEAQAARANVAVHATREKKPPTTSTKAGIRASNSKAQMLKTSEKLSSKPEKKVGAMARRTSKQTPRPTKLKAKSPQFSAGEEDAFLKHNLFDFDSSDE
eukprot:TRINITY_DN22525_c0_g1_i1.p1 TRINITY_DN22525_c0_g1~~TRINITY_DN22525_c0_g1_i1.p1  ORF type:complete len:159 (+),score=54.58 TRINITY_DN22525_c0_g1_i1:14-490(+)